MTKEQRKKIAARLAKIQKTKGTITPDNVIEDAKNPKSPLHDCFTWDDSAAAHEYRKEQARTLISSIRVEVRTKTETVKVPMYVRDPKVGAKEQGYTPLLSLKSEEAVSMAALRYEFDRAISQVRRSAEISEALGMSDQFYSLLDKCTVLRQSLDTSNETTAVAMAGH